MFTDMTFIFNIHFVDDPFTPCILSDRIVTGSTYNFQGLVPFTRILQESAGYEARLLAHTIKVEYP